MSKFGTHAEAWSSLKTYIDNNNTISLDYMLGIKEIYSDIIVMVDLEQNLYYFPIEDKTVFNSIERQQDQIRLTVDTIGDNIVTLDYWYEDEHEIMILSHGFVSKDEPKNISHIKKWITKQLI